MDKYSIAVVIMLVVFLTWLIYIIVRFGIPSSISDSFYMMEEKKKNSGWWFMGFCLGMAAPIVLFIEINGMFFLPIAGIGFLGAAPQYRRKMTSTIHVAGASIGIVGMLIVIGIVFNNWWCIGASLLAVGLLRLFKAPNITTWEETSAIVAIAVGLFIK